MVSRSQTCIIFINQIRMKIGVMFGNPETTTGGNALKFYSSVRLDIRRIGAVKEGEEVIGNRTRVKVVKNKVAPPFREAEFDILYGVGINRVGEVIDLAVERGLIEKAAPGTRSTASAIGQGRERAAEWLRQNGPAFERLAARLKEAPAGSAALAGPAKDGAGEGPGEAAA